MLLPLVCPCLQETMQRNLLRKEIVLYFLQNKLRQNNYILFKLSAYKTGVSMRIFKLQVLSLSKLAFAISGENRSLNEHLRPNFGLK